MERKNKQTIKKQKTNKQTNNDEHDVKSTNDEICPKKVNQPSGISIRKTNCAVERMILVTVTSCWSRMKSSKIQKVYE